MSKQNISVHRLYVKNLSYESLNTPEAFKDNKIDQDKKLELKVSHDKLPDKNLYEVVLTLTLTAKTQEEAEKPVFIGKVEQAGVFYIENFPDEQLASILGAYCPSILYPYASNVISQFSTLGTFSQVILPPLDFNSLYQKRKEAEEKQKDDAAEEKAKNNEN